VATRLGLQGKSFRLAAEAYDDAVGRKMSKDSMRRLTEGWGKAVDEKREDEVEKVYAPVEMGQRYNQQWIEEIEAIEGNANLSTDGGMIFIREEGWKEVKMSTISEVLVEPLPASVNQDTRSEGEVQEPKVRLHRHSYQVGLWEADEIKPHQYVEGLRRGLDHCQRLSSVNDGAPWIERITTTNYPQAVLITDWTHSDERLWKVSKAVFGEQAPQANQWAEEQIEKLWYGRVEDVLTALHALDWKHKSYPDEILQSPGYFEKRKHMMDYARFRAEGYPIGSGTVESGINTVCHHRMKRPGRGWKRENASAMLAALSEFHSGRFDYTWQSIVSSPN